MVNAQLGYRAQLASFRDAILERNEDPVNGPDNVSDNVSDKQPFVYVPPSIRTPFVGTCTSFIGPRNKLKKSSSFKKAYDKAYDPNTYSFKKASPWIVNN